MKDKAMVIVGMVVSISAFSLWLYMSLNTPKSSATQLQQNINQETGILNVTQTPGTMPNILLSGSEMIEEFTYDKDKKEFKAASNQQVFHTNGWVTSYTDGYLLSGFDGSLYKYDRSFNLLSTWKGSNTNSDFLLGIEAVTVEAGTIFVFAMPDFVILDSNLNEIGKYSFSEKELGSNKGIEDILIYSNKALLVDDLFYPIYVFSFDISERANPKKLSRFSYAGVYPHIASQWINKDSGTWYLALAEGGGSGASYSLGAIESSDYSRVSAETNTNGNTNDELFEIGTTDSAINISETGTATSDGNEMNGFAIEKDLDDPDSWFLISNFERNKVELAKIDMDSATVSQSIELGEIPSETLNYDLDRAGNLIFTLFGTELRVIDVSSQPKVIVKQTFPLLHPDNSVPIPQWYSLEPKQ